MNKTIINLFKGTIIIILLLLISSIIISLLYYFDLINNNLVKYCKMFFEILSCFIGGLYIGRKSNIKGYINGLKLSLIIVIIMFLLSLIVNNFKISRMIYYFIITICITFGSMIGINNEKN